MSKTLSWHAPVPPGAWRRTLARTLRLAGHGLSRWARRLAPAAAAATALPDADPAVEFYAEAGAPEGALFVDGRRVGVLPGVTRL